MLTSQTDVYDLVADQVRQLLEEAFLEPGDLGADDNLVLLGFDSLMLARLVAGLEQLLGVDPFATEQAHIADMQTVGDVVRLYSTAVSSTAVSAP